jgi:hypothetical protein
LELASNKKVKCRIPCCNVLDLSLQMRVNLLLRPNHFLQTPTRDSHIHDVRASLGYKVKVCFAELLLRMLRERNALETVIQGRPQKSLGRKLAVHDHDFLLAIHIQFGTRRCGEGYD